MGIFLLYIKTHIMFINIIMNNKYKKKFNKYMRKSIEEKYKVLDQISHVLLRPQTYVGSNKPNTSNRYIFIDDVMSNEVVTYIPSFIKIFDEVITNSVDEHKRNSNLNKINVSIDREHGFIVIEDNGGIPVVIHNEYNQYVPQIIFGNLMSGSNYDDSDDRLVAGLNGLGAKLTNIFSTTFEVSTSDGNKSFLQVYRDNMRSYDNPIIKKSTKKYTKIKYHPDLEKFGMTCIDEYHYKMMEKRVYDLAGCNPNINFTLNGKLINFNSFSDYIKLYVDGGCFIDKDNNWFVGVTLSDNGFQQISFVNSTETYDGGTHVDYILNQIITALRDFFQKKYKVDVRPSELKGHIFLFINCNIINPSFSSQTKEKLITESKDFGNSFQVSNKLIQQILKSDIINSILDWIQQKKNAEENKLQRELNKKLSKIKVDKLIDSKGKSRDKHSLGIFEGDSAVSAFRKYRDPQTMGAFALRGKIVNVSEITNSKLVQNQEVVNLMAAIGLKLGSVDLSNLRYGRIYFYVDSDVDGNSIAGLLINFFYKYWPVLFDMSMIYKVETPIIVAIPKQKNGKKILFYTQREYETWSATIDINRYDIKYKKGLAALVDDEYETIINTPKLTLITKDDMTSTSLDIWFGKSADMRKVELLK
jgi:DNA topoisomerase-2